MKNELLDPVLEKVKEFSPELAESLEVAIEYVPYIGKYYSHIKFKRLVKRVQEHSVQLQRIAQLYSSDSLSASFINERIFPMVLENLIEEHEDAKIEFILNGFENVLFEEKSVEAMVINYFDTLSELRYLDLKRLLYLASLTDEYRFEGVEEQAVTLNVDLKLQNIGLIGLKEIKITLGGNWNREEDVTKDNVVLYSYGKCFLRFITNRTL